VLWGLSIDRSSTVTQVCLHPVQPPWFNTHMHVLVLCCVEKSLLLHTCQGLWCLCLAVIVDSAALWVYLWQGFACQCTSLRTCPDTHTNSVPAPCAFRYAVTVHRSFVF
jgi:hypothetical protein